MLFMICPTCGEPLGNKELEYISEMKKVCDSMGVNDDIISQGNLDKDENYIKKKSKIVNELLANPCCKVRMMTYIDLVQLVKG